MLYVSAVPRCNTVRAANNCFSPFFIILLRLNVNKLFPAFQLKDFSFSLSKSKARVRSWAFMHFYFFLCSSLSDRWNAVQCACFSVLIYKAWNRLQQDVRVVDLRFNHKRMLWSELKQMAGCHTVVVQGGLKTSFPTYENHIFKNWFNSLLL